jgi:epoxide hydrolase-like predicted phosphatase
MMHENQGGRRPPLRAVIWDLGGVILRTEDQSSRERWETRLGLRRRQLEKLVFGGDVGRKAAVGQAQADEVWDSLMADFAIPESERAALVNDFWAGDRIDSSLMAYIRSLRPRFRTGMITNAWASIRELLTEHWKIADAFDSLVISAEVGCAKPDRRIYQLALRQLQLSPDEAVFIDDFEENIDGAAALGLRTLRFTSASEVMHDLNQMLDSGA